RVLADAFAADGALGSGDALIKSHEAFYVEPKLPLEVSAGDVIVAPVSCVNATPSSLAKASMTIIATPGLAASSIDPFDLGPAARVRRIFELRPQLSRADLPVTIEAHAGGYADRVERRLKVTPLGFPFEWCRGGLIGPETPARGEIVLPEAIEPGSLTS